MPVYQTGSLNTTALSAADLYVGIQAPKTRYINGVAVMAWALFGICFMGPG
ncbi:hypothetical protein [Pantoea stewartii]|uniref:hypothetical protein n=1 Tax=Pantoea stewartii TaxID=66269 RepID=UPI00370370DF